jgi:hypothetical protein
MEERISSFKELRVYQLAFERQQEIFEASNLFSVRRALCFDKSNPKIDTAVECHYMSENERKVLLEKCSRIGQMLGTMMAKPEKPCQQSS